MSNIEKYWDYLVDMGIASEETLRTITNINGYSEETLNDVLYSATGYRSLDQMRGEDDEDDEEEDEDE